MINIMVPNWAKNILFLLVYMISGLVLVIIIEGLLSGSDLTPLNTVVDQVVVHMRTPILTTLMVFVTNLGSPFSMAALSLFVAGILIFRGNQYDAVLFLTAFVVATISLTILKNVFQISRPISDIYHVEGWSFPSGHATVTTTFFFMLAYSFFGKIKSSVGKIFLILGSILGTILICFSRLYLGAHWALDILGALSLGLLSVSFTILMFNIFVANRRSLRKTINL